MKMKAVPSLLTAPPGLQIAGTSHFSNKHQTSATSCAAYALFIVLFYFVAWYLCPNLGWSEAQNLPLSKPGSAFSAFLQVLFSDDWRPMSCRRPSETKSSPSLQSFTLLFSAAAGYFPVPDHFPIRQQKLQGIT